MKKLKWRYGKFINPSSKVPRFCIFYESGEGIYSLSHGIKYKFWWDKGNAWRIFI